ncbi:MAG: single-stranded DNA-binding protein [bacterium]
MLNNVGLVGRLARDPELRYTGNGTPVVNFSIAVERNFANDDGERDVDFINIVAWRKGAENVANHCYKGQLISVDGRLQVRRNEKDGRTYTNTEVVANPGGINFLEWRSDDSSQNKSNKNTNNTQQNNNNNTSKQNNSTPKQNNNSDNESFEMDDEFDIPF